MQKKISALFLGIVMVGMVLIPNLITSAATPNEQIRYFNLNPYIGSDVTQGWTGGSNTVTMANGKLTLVPNELTQSYYGPASEYGGAGSSKVLNGILSFKHSIKFKSGATDWADIIGFRSKGVNTTWDPACEEFFIIEYPTMTKLCKKLVNGTAVDLGVINKAFINGAEYLYRISYINGSDGKCDILVCIKDENGAIYRNDGVTADYTFKVDDVEGINNAGYITYQQNPSSMEMTTFSKGAPETPKAGDVYDFSKISADNWLVDPVHKTDGNSLLITNANTQGVTYIRFQGIDKVLDTGIKNAEFNFKIKMKYKSTFIGQDWGLLVNFLASDPNSAPWETTGQKCYSFQMYKSKNTIFKSSDIDAATSLSPNLADTNNLIDDNQFHDLKITVGEDVDDSRLIAIIISIDNNEVFNFADASVLTAGGLYLMVNKAALETFEMDTKDQTSAISNVTNTPSTSPNTSDQTNLLFVFFSALSLLIILILNRKYKIINLTTNNYKKTR